MNKTIEEAATRYADENFNRHIETIQNCPWPEWEESYAKAFEAGANFSLSHQWCSVEDVLPSDDTLVIAHSPNGRVEVLRYQDGVFRDELQQAHYVDYWMELPSLNPEQR